MIYHTDVSWYEGDQGNHVCVLIFHSGRSCPLITVIVSRHSLNCINKESEYTGWRRRQQISFYKNGQLIKFSLWAQNKRKADALSCTRNKNRTVIPFESSVEVFFLIGVNWESHLSVCDNRLTMITSTEQWKCQTDCCCFLEYFHSSRCCGTKKMWKTSLPKN